MTLLDLMVGASLGFFIGSMLVAVATRPQRPSLSVWRHLRPDFGVACCSQTFMAPEVAANHERLHLQHDENMLVLAMERANPRCPSRNGKQRCIMEPGHAGLHIGPGQTSKKTEESA